MESRVNKMLYIIVGPSGSGKTTLSNIMEDMGVKRVISSTTRTKRPHEIDGLHYNFLTKKQFYNKIDANEFIEHAQFGDNFYGTEKTSILNALNSQNGMAVVVMELQGYLAMKKTNFDITGIFMNTSYDTIIKRLNVRESDDNEKRIAMIKEELSHKKYFNNEIIIEEMSLNNLKETAYDIINKIPTQTLNI